MENNTIGCYIIEEVTSLKRSLIYKKIGEGKFPNSITILGNCKGWEKQAIADWCQEVVNKEEIL